MVENNTNTNTKTTIYSKTDDSLSYYHMHGDNTLFGDQKYVTEQMLRQFAENDEYELYQIKDLWDSTDPEIRSWQNPIIKDNASYGVVEGTAEGKTVFQFSNDTVFHGSTKFQNFNTIDKDKTTAFINTAEGRAQLNENLVEVQDKSTCNNGPWGEMKSNEYWYISYNRTKTYTPAKYVKQSTTTTETTEGTTNALDLDSDGIEDYLDSTDIPAICRAQKFIAKESGYLKTLTLNLKGSSSAEYPLIVQVYKWDTSSDLPKLTKENKLATATYKFTVTSSALTAINFDSPPYLKKDEAYFFVLRSPLTSYKNAYGIGGWSKSCGEDTYPNGDCFLSENNGYSWIKHGKKDSKLKYHEGQQPPVDFAFTCHIEDSKKEYGTNEEVVYFRTQRMNPVKYINLKYWSSEPSGTSVTFYVSQDGKNWSQLNNTDGKSFGTSDSEIYNNSNSTYIFLKAVLSTTDKNITPTISQVVITCETLPARKAYFKSALFTPRTSPMLGASIWSNCYHPYSVTDNNTKVLVDIYRDQVARDRFKIIEVEDIKDYTFTESFIKDYYNNSRSYLFESEEPISTLSPLTNAESSAIAEAISSYEGSTIESSTIEGLYIGNDYKFNLTDEEVETITLLYNSAISDYEDYDQFIKDYPLIINQLRRFNIFLVGTYQIPLDKPAVRYLKSVNFTPKSTNETETVDASISLSEDHDFNVDYDFGLDYSNTTDGSLGLYELNYGTSLDSNNNTIPVVYALEDYGNTVLTFLAPDETVVDTNALNTYFKLEAGDLEIEYNPLFIKGLTMENFYKYNMNGEVVLSNSGEIVCDGFALDIMVDTFNPVYTDELGGEVFNDTCNLSVDPVCALRRVIVNEGLDDERELYEDLDFTVDYDNKKLKLLSDKFINVDDTLTVRYTPNLTDSGLGVAYRMSREPDATTGLLGQAYILPNYWQYRV